MVLPFDTPDSVHNHSGNSGIICAPQNQKEVLENLRSYAETLESGCG